MKLGDGVKKITDALGIPPCDACKERQAKLNDWGDSLLALLGKKEKIDGAVPGNGPDRTP